VSIAFLVTSPYQLFHYRAIATHMTDVTAVVEHRDVDFGLTDELILELIPHAAIERTSRQHFSSLDGRFSVIVCQTPILPLEFFEKSFVVAQQYSLAKEAYQYGVWRAHAHLNLMYGPYSVDKVKGFCSALAVGNPLLDQYFVNGRPDRDRDPSVGSRPRFLYMPTYGDLSSLNTVLPRLGDIDADFTLKLHHAEPRGQVALPSNVNLVHSDADPVRLFQQHDGVLTDFSGSAFDAIYAGLPVVLAGIADPSVKDYARLSDADVSRSLLGGVATTWSGEDDLLDSFSTAQDLVDGPQRTELVARLFVNPGTAGAACASAIGDLLENGEAAEFSVLQVRSATKRYIELNRQLRVRLARQSEPESVVAGASRQRERIRSVRRRLRVRLAKSPTLRSLVNRLRPARQSQLRITARPPMPPHQLRETIWAALAPHLEENSVSATRDHSGDGAAAAVLVQDLPKLYSALTSLGESRAGLEVHVRSDTRTVRTVPVSELTLPHLADAKSLLLGTSEPIEGFPLQLDGCLTILLVDYDSERKRYLARDSSARRVDWSELFDQPERPGDTGAIPVPIVGSVASHVAAPVDVVYTWVDSEDPRWLEQYSQYSNGHIAQNVSANNLERYVDREELRHSLRTIWMFAPFVRNIYIVTANQRPEWLADHPRVTLVSHGQIFPDTSYLPTFNSHAIEACLHRVPGLSENFLYFNDDVFLGREVDVSTFFTTKGLSKVRLSPSQYIYSGRPRPSAIPTDWAAYNSLRLIERDFSLSFDRRVKHVPLPLKRSVLAEIEERYPDAIDGTRASRFRSTTDLAVPSMFAQYYSIATLRAVEWPNIPNEYIYLDTGRANSQDRFQAILRKRPTFFCLNVTKYTELDLGTQARNVRDFLSSAFPVAAPWEVPDATREDFLP